MKANRILLCVLYFLTITSACNNNRKEKPPINNHKTRPDSVQKNISTDNKRAVNNNISSFVLSCGSGCAMTYTPESITGNLPDIKVKFKVEMFVDEQLTDTYNEIYVFSYDRSNQIREIHLEQNKDNVLETLMPNAKISFMEFAIQLVKSNS